MQNRIMSAILIGLLAAACGGSNKPAENQDTAGEKIDKAAADTEASAERTSEEAGEKLEEAGDKAKEKTKNEE